MSHRALITGVAGFAGGFLAEHLLDCGDAVLGASVDGRWSVDSSPELHEQVELIAWDLAEQAGITETTRRRIERFAPEAIYHLAAMAVPKDCGDDDPVPRARAVNVDGTRRVLELAAALPSRPRLLLTSTSHVYAPVSAENPVIDETAPTGPAHGYGRTKLEAEREVLQAVQSGKCEAVIARAFPHTGPRQRPPMMLPQWAEQFASRPADEPIEVHTLDARVDLSDVRDVVRAYRLLALRGESGEIYNVGGGEGRSSGQWFDALRRRAGAARTVREIRPGPKQDPIADTEKLLHRTGWQAKVPWETCVSDVWNWWASLESS